MVDLELELSSSFLLVFVFNARPSGNSLNSVIIIRESSNPRIKQSDFYIPPSMLKPYVLDLKHLGFSFNHAVLIEWTYQNEINKEVSKRLHIWTPEYMGKRSESIVPETGKVDFSVYFDYIVGFKTPQIIITSYLQSISVISVMRGVRYEADVGFTKSYSFVEINGLKLATLENIYRVIYDALTGHRVIWNKALNLLNDKFTNGVKSSKDDDRPFNLLIDELDFSN